MTENRIPNTMSDASMQRSKRMLVTQREINQQNALNRNQEYQAILNRINDIEKSLSNPSLTIKALGTLTTELNHFKNCKENYAVWMQE